MNGRALTLTPEQECRATGIIIRVTTETAAAVCNAHAWFEVNSGWAPPDDDTLAEWIEDGVCRCPDECLVTPDSWCQHGLASWWLILTSLDESNRARGTGG
jgi:hypothetical protein